MEKFKSLCLQDKIFYIVTNIILTLLFILILYPCVFVVSASFSSGNMVEAGKVLLWPVEFSVEGYKTVFKTATIWLGFRNSLFYTVSGTLINLCVTMLCAYCMARPDLPGRTGFAFFFAFTMFFNGGMIATFLVVNSLGMVNTIWAMILPGAMSVYNMIIARTFIQSNIPIDMLEAAQIDGCNDFRYFFKIVLPLSKTVIAVLTLYYGVGHWNAYFNAMIYLSTRDIYPLTIFLREILLISKIDPSTIADPELQAAMVKAAAVIKYALIVVTLIPILLVYPFVQKYFVKGVMIGSVKG